MAKYGCLPGDDDDWDQVKYKLKESWYFYRPLGEDGEKMLVRMMTAMQKKKDKAIKVRRHSPHAL